MFAMYFPDRRSDHYHEWFAYLVYTLSAVTGAAVLFGWWADLPIIRSVLPDAPEMKPVTALTFVFLGIGLTAIKYLGDSVASKIFSFLLGATTITVSLMLLGAFVFRFSVFADWFLVPDLSTGRMSPHSALAFLFVGASILLIRVDGVRQAGGTMAVLGFATGYVAVLGHLYHADPLYGTTVASGMAIHTSVLFILLPAALIRQDHRFALVRLLSSDTLGGVSARRLIPLVILLPTAVGWLRVLGQDSGLYETGFGTAMSTFILVTLMVSIVFFYSRTVHRADTARLAIEADLAEKEMRYRELFDYSQGLICIHDLDGKLTTVNRAATELLGYEPAEMVGRDLRDFIAPENHLAFDSYLRKVTHDGLAAGLLELVRRSGELIILRYNNILASEAGKEPYILGHAQDVTELMKAQRLLETLSLTDELTGLYNRRGFLTLAEQQLRLERHQRTALGLILLFIDMDGLKAINDNYGHEAGSEAIKTLAGLLRNVLREADLVARWGGDEFVVLSIGSENENVGLMVDRITARLAAFNETSDLPYHIECSIGVTPVTVDSAINIETVLDQADKAMYEEKKRRKRERGYLPGAASHASRPAV